MPQQSSSSSFFEDLLRYTFVYFPTTNWQRAFSPSVYFGCNVEDAGVEQHVVDKVGSYGSQINRILDVLSVLVSRMDRASLTPDQQDFVRRFELLAAQADQASAEYQGKQRHAVTETEVDQLMDRIRELKVADLARYETLLNRVRAALAVPA